MRTVELINLLRSRDRNSTQAKAQLSSLPATRLRHLLGETSNWLRAEIQKYQDRSRPQVGGLGSSRTGVDETEQQAEIRAQIRRTLLAIIVIVDCDNHGISSSDRSVSEAVSTVAAAETEPLSSTMPPQELMLSDRTEEKILDSLLVPILIGIRPLSPQTDSMDIQLLCAKILCYCVCPPSPLPHGSLGPLFSSQKVVKRMMELTRKSRNRPRQLDKDRSSLPSSLSSSGSTDAVEGLLAMLRSPLIKLQDYGLRIIVSHQRTMIAYEESWDLVAPLVSIVQSLVTNLEGPVSNPQQPSITTTVPTFSNNANDIGSDGQHISQELESEIGNQLKALILLQCYLQEAGKSIGGSSPHQPSSSSSSIAGNSVLVGSAKWRKLQASVSIPLIFELWRAIQICVLIDKTEFKNRDKIVLHATATVYWLCWVFQEKAVRYLLDEAADTLMAWYGFFIVSRDQVLTPQERPSDALVHSQDDIKHQSAVLEYLSQLLRNLVTSKKNQETLFSGNRPVGIVIIRRTIEFLENILDKAVPIFDDDNTEPDSSGNDNSITNSIPPISFSVQMLQHKPGILEAMLGIMRSCLGVTKEADGLVLHTRLVNILVLALSDIKTSLGTRTVSSSMSRRTQVLVLNLLIQILKRDVVPGLEDIPKDQWTQGYASLVDMIMTPLELEADEILSSSSVSGVSNGSGSIDGLGKMSQEQDAGIRALRVYLLFWKHHAKGHNEFADLFGPRFYRLRILLVLMNPSNIGNSDDKDGAPASRPTWVQDRTLLLLETMVSFGAESSVRINMRERWSSLLFLSVLIAANTSRLVHQNDSLAKAIVLKCLLGLRNFWFDRLGLSRLIEMEFLASEDDNKVLERLPSVQMGQSSDSTFSLVPILLTILAPPNIAWTSDLILHQRRPATIRIAHPLFESYDAVLVEAALLLYQLSQFIECQQYLISKPGAIWILGRMMVERTLVGTPPDPETEESSQGQNVGEDDEVLVATKASSEVSSVAARLAKEDIMPRELLEKILFDTLTRILSSVDLAKTLISNNTITELFAAILETDRPLCFCRSKLSLELSNIVPLQVDTDDSGRVQSEMDQILPVPRHLALHQQLLAHFRGVMSRSRSQFETIFKYVGGHRSLQQDMDESAETMYWLREFGALVFLYLSGPTEWTAAMTKVDKLTLLSSESVLGIVCRMLTLEVQYEPEESQPQLGLNMDLEVDQEVLMRETVNNHKPAISDTAASPSESLGDVQKEEAMLRKFSAGLAIQSLCWRHADSWRQQHLSLRRSYDSVLTTEWETHVAMLKGSSPNNVSRPTVLSGAVEFLVQGRVLVFQNRLILSRSSNYFQALLTSDFMETSQNQIHIGDLDPDDFELLLEIIKESEMTSQFLLPEDLSFEMVLRLLICADRFLVEFVKRLAEVWILDSLARKELRYYKDDHDRNLEIATGSGLTTENRDRSNGLKHGRDSSPSLVLQENKRLKVDYSATASSSSSSSSSLIRSHGNDPTSDAHMLDPQKNEDDEDLEPLPDCLLMIYETCSHPRFGNMYSPKHPFFGLLWDTLKRMALRLQTVAITSGFATLLDHEGEDKIQELLQILYELIENTSP